MVLHGVDPDAAYQNMYELVCPQVSAGWLQLEDRMILRKLFGGLKGTDLTLDTLEDEFLGQNPVYVHGHKRKCAKVPTSKVISTGLAAAMPKEFITDDVLQEVVKGRFKAFIKCDQKDFKDAGFKELYPEQVSSVVVGSMVRDTYGFMQFGERV